MEAPTRADWWLGLVELTTAVFTRWVKPAVEPAQSNARLYEATTCTHSRKFHKKTPRLPVRAGRCGHEVLVLEQLVAA